MARFLYFGLALVTVACAKLTLEAECIKQRCDVVCSQSATSDKSDPIRTLRCLSCVDACKGD